MSDASTGAGSCPADPGEAGDADPEQPADAFGHQLEIPFSRQALHTVITDHRAAAVRAATGLVEDNATAEDVAQKAFIDLTRRWQQQRVMREPRRLLFQLVKQRALDERRRRTPIPVVDDDLISKVTAERVMAMPDFAPGIDGLFTSTKVIMALKQLPVRQQQVIALHIGLDWDMEAVAAVMACSVPAAKSLQQRGLDTLRNSDLLTGYRTPTPEVRQ